MLSTLIPAESAAWGFSPTDLNLNPHLVNDNKTKETIIANIVTNIFKEKKEITSLLAEFPNSNLPTLYGILFASPNK